MSCWPRVEKALWVSSVFQVTIFRVEIFHLCNIDKAFVLNPLNASVTLIETSQLIYRPNQLTGFCMRATLTFNGLIYRVPTDLGKRLDSDY